MQRLCGFIEKGYRFEVQVPTTIFDSLGAKLTAYNGKKVIDSIYIPLKKMPTWNVPAQGISLCKKDEKTLEKITNKFVKLLPYPPNYMH